MALITKRRSIYSTNSVEMISDFLYSLDFSQEMSDTKEKKLVSFIIFSFFYMFLLIADHKIMACARPNTINI